MIERNKTAFSLLELSLVLVVAAIFLYISFQKSIRTSVDRATLTKAQNLTKNSLVNTISNLELWLETTMPSNILDTEADNNKSVSTWYDLSPNKINVTQSTAANKPLYITNGINNLPILRFDGSNDSLVSSANFNLLGNPDFTIFVVANITGGGSNAPWVNFGTAASTNSVSFGRQTSNGQIFSNFNGGNSNYAYSNNSIIAIHDWVRFGGGDSNTGNTVYINGTAQTITNTTTITPEIKSNLLRIGSDGTNFIGADIGEIIIFSKGLTDFERKSVEKYLGNKWGITVS